MTWRPMTWELFHELAGSDLPPMLGPLLDQLKETGGRPPTLRWRIQWPDGDESTGSYPRVRRGRGTLYTTRDKAERELRARHAWEDRYGVRARLDARVVLVVQIEGGAP